MLEFEEKRQTLVELEPKLKRLADALDLENSQKRLSELDEKAGRPGFWDDAQSSQQVLQEAKALRSKVDGYNHLRQLYGDTLELIELADEMQDLSVLDEIQDSVRKIDDLLETQTLATLLTGEYDHCNAIVTLHAGAGGTEAQDWVEMLYRMYCMWAERHRYKYKVLDYLDGDEAGIKSASILIEGENVYGFLRSEAGVHRLVRISPFDSSGRRHTSFASVEVMPEITGDTAVEIDEKDLRIDTYRASGAGGQHVNKTESAIRITHLPSGIVVACQNERSQRQNREVAMKMLIARLIEIKEREHLEKIDDIKGVQKEIAWGNQIRSYVFMPYTLVKDHRTGCEVGNIDAVMNGGIDEYINAYLRDKSLGKL